MERRLPKTSREDSGHQHDIGESQRPNEAHANKRPIRDFDAYLRQIAEQQQLAMKADKEEQNKIIGIISRMMTPEGNNEVEREKRYYQKWSQSGGVSGEAYQKKLIRLIKHSKNINAEQINLEKAFDRSEVLPSSNEGSHRFLCITTTHIALFRLLGFSLFKIRHRPHCETSTARGQRGSWHNVPLPHRATMRLGSSTPSAMPWIAEMTPVSRGMVMRGEVCSTISSLLPPAKLRLALGRL